MLRSDGPAIRSRADVVVRRSSGNFDVKSTFCSYVLTVRWMTFGLAVLFEQSVFPSRRRDRGSKADVVPAEKLRFARQIEHRSGELSGCEDCKDSVQRAESFRDQSQPRKRRSKSAGATHAESFPNDSYGACRQDGLRHTERRTPPSS